MPREQLLGRPAERFGDSQPRLSAGDVQAVHPGPHLSRVDSEALREPRLTAAVGVERLAERGVQAGTFHPGTDCTRTIDVLSSGLYTTCMDPMAELIADLLPALKEKRGLSWSELSRRTVAPGNPGIGEGTIKALVKEKHRGRVPDAEIIEALAAALDVEPGVFYEYPIAAARRVARTTRQAAARQRERPAPPGGARRSRDGRERRS